MFSGTQNPRMTGGVSIPFAVTVNTLSLGENGSYRRPVDDSAAAWIAK